MDTAKTKNIVVSSRTFILFFLVCNPFIEILYATITVGSAGSFLNINRLLRFAVLFVMLIDIKSRKNVQKLFWIVVAFIVSYVGICVANVQLNMGTDISYLLKIYMGFVAYYYFYEKLITGKLTESEVFSSLIYASIIISGSILLSYIGIGNLSYGNSSRFGYQGLFSIVCTPSAYLIMVLPLAMQFDKKLKWVVIILSCLALLSLGTKTGVIGLAMFFAVVWCYYLVHGMKKSTALMMLGGTVIGAIAAIVLIYRYIPYLVNLFVSHSYYNGSIYSFMLSNRDTQVSLAKQYFVSLTGFPRTMTFLCGSGYSRIENVLNSIYSGYHAVEMDFHALFFCCGSVILILVLYRIINAIKIGYINWKHIKSQEDFYLLLALSIATVHACLGGHVLTDSMCIFPIYIIMAVISVRRVKAINKNSI